MQIRLTVLGHGDAAGGVDVQITAPADTPLSDVLGALAGVVTPGSAAPGAVFCEEQHLDPRRAALGQPPLVDGAVLSFHGPVEGPGREPVPARLLVVAGPDAGGVHLLRGGVARIGRSAGADIPLDDPDVSRTHCAVALGEDGTVTVTDLDSTNGTSVDGVPVTGGPVTVRPGAVLRLGESALRLVADGAAAGPPPPAQPAPVPAAAPRAGRRGLTGWALGRLAGPADAREEPGPPAAAPAEDAAAARWPDPATVLLTALEPGPRRWERGAAHPEAFTVRLGTAQRASGALRPVTVGLPEAGSLGLTGPRERVTGVARSVLAQLAALHPPSALELVVVAVDRTEEWSWLGWLPHVRPARGQDCRLLLAFDPRQAAARTAELTASLGRPRGARRTVVLVDGDPGTQEARSALARLAADGPAAGIHLLALAETPPATAASPLAQTLGAARATSPVLAACGTVGVLSGPVATALRLVGPDGAPGPAAGADAVSLPWAERLARALAPAAESTTGGAAGPADAMGPPAAAPPESCRLLDALELSRVTPGALRARWAGQPGLPLVLGAGTEGPVAVELADASGPLAVTGPAKSGRTELLSAMAASLAAAQGPASLSLLLIEGAGDGLAPCAELPHVASYLGATDPVRMRVFAQALRDELRRRAALLGETDFDAGRPRAAARVGAPRSGGSKARSDAPTGADVPGMLAAGSGPMPWLVILVDDFDALLSPALGAPGRQAAGSVVRAVEAAARDGRRLGVRVVTAGQDPAMTGSAAIRIALAGAPPGRAELWRGADRVIPFQGGRVTGRIPRTATLRPTVARLDWARAGDPPTRRPVRELGNGPTDVALLASAAARAAQTDRATTVTLV
ncbi:FHA domain-containing protein [Streptomyces sp. NBC_01803]|uniref:FHA domain-containing protein n=1 Tax=Streptomyces sp. NBC_01803 TaxID=2975946 RepID=UPI002DDB9768|nr:FHA domain-containing protein [Streptomyces sp. NBC_01803]WSA47566.1 FtsK/SpoIIIE domain-containing protein [Streptomyces sp. NBC_01803]